MDKVHMVSHCNYFDTDVDGDGNIIFTYDQTIKCINDGKPNQRSLVELTCGGVECLIYHDHVMACTISTDGSFIIVYSNGVYDKISNELYKQLSVAIALQEF